MVRIRKPARTPSVYQSKDDLPAHLKERYAVMLEDYDRRVEEKIAELKNNATVVAEKAYNQYMLEMMKLPKSVRSLNWEEVLTVLKNQEPEKEKEKEEKKTRAEEEIRKMKEKIASDVRLAIKKSPSKRRRNPPSSRKRAAAAAAPEPHDETVLTSTANATRSRTRRGLQTPCDISMVVPREPPLITPRVNGVTPFIAKNLLNSVVRNAKPNETTFSINGSPVCVLTGAAAKRTATRGRKTAGPAATVRLGSGKELVLASLDTQDNHGIQLDEESRAKVLAVKNELDKLLQLRDSTNL